MQFQIGTEFFGRVIFWHNVPLIDFISEARPTVSAPGIELTADEIMAIFGTGIIQRSASTGKYYRLCS